MKIFSEADREIVQDEIKMTLEDYYDVIKNPANYINTTFFVKTEIACENVDDPIFRIDIIPTNAGGDTAKWVCSLCLCIADRKSCVPILYMKKSTFSVTESTFDSTARIIADRIITFTQEKV